MTTLVMTSEEQRVLAALLKQGLAGICGVGMTHNTNLCVCMIILRARYGEAPHCLRAA